MDRGRRVGTYSVRGSRTLLIGLTPAGLARRNAQGTGVGHALRSTNDRLVGGPALHVPAGYGIPVELLVAWVDEVRFRWSGPLPPW